MDNYYTLVNVRYKCSNCDKIYSKLMNPSDSITCETCGQQNCEKVAKKKKVIKRENIRRESRRENDGSYRMIFSRDNRSHNRTDPNDRNLENIYGDARASRQQRRREYQEEEKVPNNNQNNARNHRRAPMPDNPFDSSYSSGSPFTNMGFRRPPSRTQAGQNPGEPIRINLNRSNTENQANTGGCKFTDFGYCCKNLLYDYRLYLALIEFIVDFDL